MRDFTATLASVNGRLRPGSGCSSAAGPTGLSGWDPTQAETRKSAFFRSSERVKNAAVNKRELMRFKHTHHWLRQCVLQWETPHSVIHP